MDEQQLASLDLLASMDVASAALNGKAAAKAKRSTSRQTGAKPPVSSSTLSSRLQQQKARLQKASRAEQQVCSSSSKIAAENSNRTTPVSDDQADEPAVGISQPQSRTRSRSISPSAFATITIHKVDAAVQHSISTCKQASALTRTGSRAGMKPKQKLPQTGDDQGEQQSAVQLPSAKSRPSSRRTSRSQVMHNDEQEDTSALAGQRHQAESRKETDTSKGTATALKKLRTASGLDADSAAAAAAAAAAIAAAAVVAAAMPNPDDVLGGEEHAAAAIKAAEQAAAAAAAAAAEQAAMAAAAAAAEQAVVTAAAKTITAHAAETWPVRANGQHMTDHVCGRQRKRTGRPPKAAVVNMPAPAAVSNQHHQQLRGPLGRLSSMGDGRRISIDEPYRHALGAEHGADLNTCSPADMVTSLDAWQNGPVAATTGAPAAAVGVSCVRTRLSMRSVVYLEDLLQQTEAETAVDASASNSKAQHTGRAGTRGSSQHAGASAIEHRRLSIGNLIISPPMSRATSTSLHVLQAGGSSQPNSGESAGVAQMMVTKQHDFSKVDEARSKQKAEQAALSYAAPQHGQDAAAADTKSGSRRNSVSEPRADDQPPAGRRTHAAGAGTHSTAAGAMKLPEAAELTRAAAAAVAAWQLVTAVEPKAREAGNMQSSSDEDSDDQEAAAWAAAATAAAGGKATRTGPTTDEALDTYAKIQDKHRHSRSRRGSYSSDTSSDPSSGSPVFDSCIMGAFAAGSNAAAAAAGSLTPAGVAAAAGGSGAARELLYGGLLQGFGGAPAATVMFQGCRPNALTASTAAGPAPPGVAGTACATDRVGWHHAEGPRKSDRQVGLETVQRIDSILQQSRSGVLATSAVTVAACPASNCAVAGQTASSAGNGSHQQQQVDNSTGGLHVASAVAASGASTPPSAAIAGAHTTYNTAAVSAAAADVERCSVAALCRGLRFDGDITLKEVAMAFQLRDAYDWDEDLEAAAKEASKAADADPRLKGPRLLSRSPSLSNSSVCPDPEPAPGVLPRSTWMAGNRDGPSPIPSVLVQKSVRAGHHCGSSDYRGDLHAAGSRCHSLLQRLHKGNVESHDSVPGSITSSRRDSLAGSPVCGLRARGDGVTSHPGDMYQPPAPAVLHAALTAAQQQQAAGSRGWQAMLPNSNGATSDTESDRQVAQLQKPLGASTQPAFGVGVAYSQHSAAQQVQARTGPGRGHHRRKKRSADDSDDDYDPSKPSHQQECYQRKQYVKRQQQQYHYLQQQHQRMMHGRMARLSYGGTILPQQYSAAIQQQMYMLQAAARAGGGLTLQQVQQLQQLQFIQHQQIAAMAAAEQQAALAAAAAAANGGGGAAAATQLDSAQQQETKRQHQFEQHLRQHGVVKPSSPETKCDQSPACAQLDDAKPQEQQLPKEQQQLQQERRQSSQAPDQQPAQQQQQQPQGQQQEPVQQQSQQQQQEQTQLQPQQEVAQQAPQQQQDQQVRRPSYVKRRLTASDAADWLQSHGCQQIAQPSPIQNSMQQEQGLPMSCIGPSRFSQMVRAESQELGLHIVSPTAHRDPAHSMLQQQRHRQLAAAAIAAAAPSPAHSAGFKRTCKQTASGMLLDAQLDVNCTAVDEDSLAGPGDVSTEDDSEIESDVSDAEVGYSAGSRGRGRGRRGRGRGRIFAVRGGRGGRNGASLLSQASTPPLSPASSVPSVAGLQDSPVGSPAFPAFGSRGRGRVRGRARGRSLLGPRAPSPGPAGAGLGMHAGAGGVPVGIRGASAPEEYAVRTPTAAAVTAADTAAALPAAEAAVQAGDNPASQGRGRGRGRGRRGRGSLLMANGWGGGFAGSIESISSLSAAASSAGRSGARGRGRGRGRARLPPFGAYGMSPATPAYGNDSACQLAAGEAAADGLPPQKRQRLVTSFAHTGGSADPVEYRQQQQHALVGMPAWFAAGLVGGTGASNTRALASPTHSLAVEEQLMLQHGLISPGSSRLPRSSQGLLGPISNPKGNQQLYSATGLLQVEQRSVQGGAWVMQVTDGGVVVQVPAGDLLCDGDDQLMQDLGPMSELTQGLGAVEGQEDLL